MISLKYFDLIGMDAQLKQKADQIKNNLTNLNGFNPQKVYVTEYLRSDQKKVFENLVFLSNGVICEVKNFSTEERYTLYKVDSNVAAVQIMKNDHDFKSFNQVSRIHARIIFRYGVDFTLKGTGENCRFLVDLLNTVFFKDLNGAMGGL